MVLRKVLFRGFLLVFSLLAIGTIFFYFIENLSVVDSFYLAGVTLTTLGFGDIVPVTDIGKVFSVFYTLVGIGTLFFIMGKLFHIIFSHTLLDPVFHERHQLLYRKLAREEALRKNREKK